MDKQLILILGGARSGKSDFAERLAAHLSPEGSVTYVATATVGDDEMAARIAAHRAHRPATWHTLEVPARVGAAVLNQARYADVILLDCLTLLVSNVLMPAYEGEPLEVAKRRVAEEMDALLAAYRHHHATWIVVSNEVGMGLVPPYPLGREYRDALGRANRRLAATADRVLFMVAGIPLDVKALQARDF